MDVLPSLEAKADTFCPAMRDIALLPIVIHTMRNTEAMSSAIVLNFKGARVCIHVAQAFQDWPWMYSQDADLAGVGLHVSSCNN